MVYVILIIMLVFIFFQIDIAHLKRRALFKSNGSKYCL